MDAFIDSLGVDHFYFKMTYGFALFAHLFESYIDYRQHKKLQEKVMPPQLKGIVDEKKFAESQSYGLAKSNFGFVSGAFEAILTVIQAFYLNVALWEWTGSLCSSWAASTGYDWIASDSSRAATSSIISYILSKLIHLPFSWYSMFVLEAKYDFNKTTYSLFFIDMIKETLLYIVLMVPILTIFLKVIEWGGRFFYIYASLFLAGVVFFMMMIYPNVIAPLFNKFEPLPDGELRTAIEELARKEKFPLTQLYVVDGSLRSSHSNAYFYGFFKSQRIVLYDTLIKQLDTKGIVAVLAHELGHWAKSHNIQRIAFTLVQMFVFMFLYGQMSNSERLYRDFGYKEPSTYISFMCFMAILEPVGHVLGFFMNMWSRKHEFEADAFAVSRGFDNIADALKVIAIKNLGALNPDPIYSAYNYSHPPLVERLRAIEAESKRRK